MQLSFEKIKEISVGAVAIWQEADGVHFGKCTAEQIAVYAECAPWLVDNAKATTGCKLDFHTDGSTLILKVKDGGRYEIKVNERLLISQKGEAERDGFCFRLPLGKEGEWKRVSVALPMHGTGGVIRLVEIEKASSVIRHKFDRKFLFLGDSITQGWNAEFGAFAHANLIGDFFNAETVIQGIGGAFFEAKTVLPLGFAPDVVFVSYGTNDFNRFQTLKEIEERATEYLKSVKTLYSQAKIFVVSPIWRMDEDAPSAAGEFSDCQKAIQEIAKGLAVEVVDGGTLVPPQAKLMADDLHPNDLGFTVYALNLIKAVYKRI